MKRRKPQCEVVVGNVGLVYSGTDHAEAMRIYLRYRQISQDGVGRPGGEAVTLFVDGRIEAEYAGKVSEL